MHEMKAVHLATVAVESGCQCLNGAAKCAPSTGWTSGVKDVPATPEYTVFASTTIKTGGRSWTSRNIYIYNILVMTL